MINKFNFSQLEPEIIANLILQYNNEILLEKWSKKIIDQTYIQHKSTSRSQSGQLRWYHTLQVKFDLLV
jgi:hypothetical protein